jgi:hypothetical protein
MAKSYIRNDAGVREPAVDGSPASPGDGAVMREHKPHRFVSAPVLAQLSQLLAAKRDHDARDEHGRKKGLYGVSLPVDRKPSRLSNAFGKVLPAAYGVLGPSGYWAAQAWLDAR